MTPAEYPPEGGADERASVPRRSTFTPPAGEPSLPDELGVPDRPRRVSLHDEDLVRTLGPEVRTRGHTLDALEQLERQLRLREREAREFREWEGRMRAIGTAEALTSVEDVRTDFIDVIATPPAGVQEPAVPVADAQPNDALQNSAMRRPQPPVYATPSTVDVVAVPEIASAVPTPGDAEPASVEGKPSVPPGTGVEINGPAPTPLDRRVGRTSRLFWLWFAVNSSVLSVVVGAALFSLGMSLRQSILATLAGGALSFLPLGLGTLAGKRSGQPTMIVSRATFGLVGNILPASLALVSRLFWGAVLLWMLAASVARIIVVARLNGPLNEAQLAIVTLAAALLVALVVAFLGYAAIVRIQLVVSIVSALLVAGLVVLTAPSVDIRVALTIGDGPWILVVTGAVIVFSFVGLVWANSSADLARYQRPGSSGAASMVLASIGTTLPPFVLVSYGALLAASNPDAADGLLSSPIDTIAAMIPAWYPIPLIAAVSLSLLSGVVITIYSGGFALQAIGVRMQRQSAIVVVGFTLATLAVLLIFFVDGFALVLRDVTTTLAVPIAAWAGIFVAEMMIRQRHFHSRSLLERGGIYPDVNWLNLSALLGASAVGLGLTSATVVWLGWEGYLFALFGVPLDSDLAGSDLGVIVALLIGLAAPLVAGVRTVRGQERAVSAR